MKELSIEEKAKRYDEAINKAKSKIKNDKDHVLYENDVIEIFPELKESGDERIRKALIDGFKRYDDGALFNGCLVKEILSWLEKQGEQKPAAWSEKDDTSLVRALAFIQNTSLKDVDEIKESVLTWITSLKDRVQPRHHWKPSDEQMTQLKKYCPDNRPLTSLYEQLNKLSKE
jgi:hypothetical protein